MNIANIENITEGDVLKTKNIKDFNQKGFDLVKYAALDSFYR